MPIRTPRLLICPRQTGEGPRLHEAVHESLEIMRPWMPWAHDAYPLDEAESHCRRASARFTLREDLTLSIYDATGKRLLGSTGLHNINWSVRSFHIGYWIRQSEQGKGYVTEAVNALARYAFDALEARRVEIRCDSRNTRSLKVMQRLGFEQEGLLRADSIGVQGEARDTIVTARTSTIGLPALEVNWL
jgi:RimJ/RimL family protein N-acetyltransferase